MTKQEKKQLCIGCRNNFYNGNNDLGVKECWSLKDAKLIPRVEVSIHQRPPWNQAARKLFQCYRAEGYAYLTPDFVRTTNARASKD